MFKRRAQGLPANRDLILELVFQELQRINYGSILGLLWLVLTPLLTACIYIVVLGIVLPVRLGPSSSPLEFAQYVISGFMVWHIITQSLIPAPALFLNSAYLLRYVPYPVEMLSLPKLTVSMLGGMVMFFVYLVIAAFGGTLEWTLFLLPIPLMLLAVFLTGMSWILMVLGVFLRDLSQTIAILFNALIYMSPILFTEQVVGRYWGIILLNPFSHIIISFRDVLYNTWHPVSWAIFGVLAVSAFVTGAWMITTAHRSLQNFL